MAEGNRGGQGTDPLLLAEAALVLVFFALLVYLFLVPVGSPPGRPHWWAWIVVGAVFFGVIAIDTVRRKRRRTGPARPWRTPSEPPDEPVPPPR